MTGRQAAGLGVGAFLAGVGATAVAAYAAEQAVKVQRHRLELRMVTPQPPSPFAEDFAKSQRELRVAEGHVRALLRAPRVSETDRETDRRAAQEWLRERDR